jgi:hypothetical protein
MDNNLADGTLLVMRLIQTGFALFVGTVVFHRWILVRCAAVKLYCKSVEFRISDGEFVERPDLDREFTHALQAIESKTVLVYGIRGMGKRRLSSTLSERSAESFLSTSRRMGTMMCKQR